MILIRLKQSALPLSLSHIEFRLQLSLGIIKVKPAGSYPDLSLRIGKLYCTQIACHSGDDHPSDDMPALKDKGALTNLWFHA